MFLRTLEYCKSRDDASTDPGTDAGILFLTTNRVGSFDEAFRSRINMILEYPPLEDWQTREIWQMNLQRLQDLDPDLEVNEKAI